MPEIRWYHTQINSKLSSAGLRSVACLFLICVLDLLQLLGESSFAGLLVDGRQGVAGLHHHLDHLVE